MVLIPIGVSERLIYCRLSLMILVTDKFSPNSLFRLHSLVAWVQSANMHTKPLSLGRQ